MVVFPNIKVNIGLNVVNRRADGYHDIETVMIPIEWTDVLEIVPAKGRETTLTVTGRNVSCPLEDNLVMKAYNRLSREADIPPVDIFLHKIIPDGAGLGGGSSDAAFMFTALNELFSLGYDKSSLALMAGDVGADCPFFIYNRPMLCTGIGTVMSPISIDLSGYTIVIVKPDVSVSTKEAYFGVKPAHPLYDLRHIVESLRPEYWTEGGVINDFEKTVLCSHPEIGAAKQNLIDMGAVYAAMSGSGASVFGIFSCDILSEQVRHVFHHTKCFIAKL